MVVDGRGGGDIGKTNILALLAKMPLGRYERLGKMFTDEMRGEAGISGVIAGINGRCPCRYNGAESGAMEITDEIQLGRNVIGAVSIICTKIQIVLDGGFRARSKVDIVVTVADIAIAGDGEILFDQCEMVLGKGSS